MEVLIEISVLKIDFLKAGILMADLPKVNPHRKGDTS
jgi:hypothetical protein